MEVPLLLEGNGEGEMFLETCHCPSYAIAFVFWTAGDGPGIQAGCKGGVCTAPHSFTLVYPEDEKYGEQHS